MRYERAEGRCAQFSLDGRVVTFLFEKLLVELPGGVEELTADRLEARNIQEPILADLCEIAVNPFEGETEVGLGRFTVASGQCG